jgi:two-component system, cell cycle sensor histidine kinase and response regulator CckA
MVLSKQVSRCTRNRGLNGRVLRSYLLSISSTLLSLLITFQLPESKTNPVFVFYMGAVIFSTWYGGRGPGLVTLLSLSMIMLYFFLAGMRISTAPLQTEGLLLSLVGFIITAWLVAELVARLKSARDEAVRQLESRNSTESALQRSADQLRQAQKMESLGRLAGGVAHDFNNLLNVIIGYSELLIHGLASENDLRRNAEKIDAAANLAIKLTKQLLAFSRDQSVQPRVLDLNKALLEMAALLPRLLSEDIELVIVPGLELKQVKVDQVQIQQIIMNLAVNARDAMANGGRLNIETSNVEVEVTTEIGGLQLNSGRYVMLTVSDTGSGMDPATMSHIFEPFFTTKELGKGTGLGLSTVKDIVNANGGVVGVYSKQEGGTTFNICLPAVDSTPIVELPVSLHGWEPSPVPMETVLLVEDAQALRELTREFLKMRGYRVLDAGNAAEAMQISQQHPQIDVVITDVVMPGMSGVELADRLLELRPEAKILFTSGYAEEIVFRHGLGKSGVPLLEKPYTFEALEHALQGLLHGDGLLQRAV